MRADVLSLGSGHPFAVTLRDAEGEIEASVFVVVTFRDGLTDDRGRELMRKQAEHLRLIADSLEENADARAEENAPGGEA